MKAAATNCCPVPTPAGIFCAGANFTDHMMEMAKVQNIAPEPDPHEVGLKPWHFIKLMHCLAAPDSTVKLPAYSKMVDWEAELTAVIGRPARDVSIERALDHVAGYTCFVDGSVRDYQKFSVTSGKNFPGTGPLGPWMVTTDEIPDPTKLTLMTRLNGQEMQRSGTDLLIYSVPHIIAFCSDFTPLSPGDVIATGTPEGVGHRRSPQLWMKPGDVLEVEITGIGVLRSHVVDAK